MSVDAIALLQVPGWEPPDELDVRELEDGVLVFLEISFESDDDAILDALEEAVGDVFYEHEDDRGIFVLPDAAEPDDAETYDEVVAAAAEVGRFIPLDPVEAEGAEAAPTITPEALAAQAESMLGQIFESLGAGSGDDIVRALREGDRDALTMARIQMQSALEGALRPAEPQDDDDDEKQ